MGNALSKLKATIKSGYYFRDQNGKQLKFYTKNKAYEYLKAYILKYKDPTDIVVFDDLNLRILVNTVNKQLPLDRLVYIDKNEVDIDNLNNNLL